MAAVNVQQALATARRLDYASCMAASPYAPLRPACAGPGQVRSGHVGLWPMVPRVDKARQGAERTFGSSMPSFSQAVSSPCMQADGRTPSAAAAAECIAMPPAKCNQGTASHRVAIGRTRPTAAMRCVGLLPDEIHDRQQQQQTAVWHLAPPPWCFNAVSHAVPHSTAPAGPAPCGPPQSPCPAAAGRCPGG